MFEKTYETKQFRNSQKMAWGSIAWLIEPDNSGVGRVSIGILSFDPFQKEEEHYHAQEEHLIYIISGQGSHTVNGQKSPLKSGDYAYLPPFAVHELVNEGPEALVLLAIYAPTGFPGAPAIIDGLGDPQENLKRAAEKVVFDFEPQPLGHLLEKLSQAMNMNLLLLDSEGNFLHPPTDPPGFCRIMTGCAGQDYCRAHLGQSIRSIAAGSKARFFTCCNDITTTITPVRQKGVTVAYLKCGEVFLSSDDKNRLLDRAPELAEDYGLSAQAVLEAGRELPIVPKGRLHPAAEGALSVANTLVGLMHAKARQREMDELRVSLMREQLETEKQEKALRESSLKLLQSQINPHFLFNTLNSAAQLAYVEGAHKATQLICYLSELLRYTLRKTEQLIPLSEEFALLNNYVAIQRYRYGDRISFSISPPPVKLKNVMVPCMILQPLVENSILHGLDPRPDGGEIKVEVRELKGRVRVLVEDDGVGFEARLVSSRSDKIGLNSTRGRLRHYFGDKSSLNLSTVPGQGTRVELNFPF
jgi:Predicted signal transduction protein with a C-terminal ATPase domain